MAYNTKKILRDRNGDPIPQSYDSDGDRYVPSEIDTRLKAIENQQQEILERLDKPIDTQVTGSNVEQDVNVKNYPDTQKVEVTNQQEIPDIKNKSKTVFDGVTFKKPRAKSSVQNNKYAKGILISVQINSIVGKPVDGVGLWVRFVIGGNDYGAYVLPEMKKEIRRIGLIYPGVNTDIPTSSDFNFIQNGTIPEEFNLEMRNLDSSNGVEYNCTVAYSFIA